MTKRISGFNQFMGIDPSSGTQREKIISSIGGCIGIFAVYAVSSYLLGAAAIYIIPSMGASAVLLFAAPHSPLAQPWNLLCGHLVSALAGVLCAQFVTDIGLAAALAVGLAIGAMYYLRCIHPPGGATALAAVIGGTQIRDLGFEYLVNPVLLNTLTIFALALLFNWFFDWRRYPACLTAKTSKTADQHETYAPISHADLVYALSQIDSFIDVSEADLLRIYRLATGRKVRAADDRDDDADIPARG